MPPSPPARLRIVIVDDEQAIRRTMALCLETEGHQVAAVGTRADAVGEAKRQAFDLLHVLRRLVELLAPAGGRWDVEVVLERIEERKRQRSTFMNHGLALAHARLAGLRGPRLAIGLTQGGISDLPGEAVLMVVLVLTPPGDQGAQLRLLALAARMHQRLELRRELARAASTAQAYAAIASGAGAEGARA